MCFSESHVMNLNKWNWDGDVIIHIPIVPSSRPVVGYVRKHDYDIDVREFLITGHNALIQRVLHEDLVSFIKTDLKGDLDLFRSRNEYSFDYRAHVVTAFVSETIVYLDKENIDPWQFPDETLHEKSGDCEDRALLIASLLIASGISPFNVRVALGKVNISGGEKKIAFDHVWVMYKTESGQWVLIEPLICSGLKGNTRSVTKHPGQVEYFGTKPPSLKAEYIPYYLFNNCHLWGVLGHGRKLDFQNEIRRKKKWSKFNPKFAGEVHRGILHQALEHTPPKIQTEINRYYSRAFLGIVGPYVDLFDRGGYDPAVHCDNCYIQEGWKLVKENLMTFKDKQDFRSFFKAAHTIADFYAHASYVHFAKIVAQDNPDDDYAELFHPDDPQFEIPPSYLSGLPPQYAFDLTGKKFTIHKTYWKGTDKAEIAKMWAGKLISGRYAQPHDTWQGVAALVTEGILSVIPDKVLQDSHFPERGWVPHHNEIAVDQEQKSPDHRLYVEEQKDRFDKGSYPNQYKWRRNTAIKHIRKVFDENWNPQV
jgi:hypothetical protein